jgi:hypothetical protein
VLRPIEEPTSAEVHATALAVALSLSALSGAHAHGGFGRGGFAGGHGFGGGYGHEHSGGFGRCFGEGATRPNSTTTAVSGDRGDRRGWGDRGYRGNWANSEASVKTAPDTIKAKAALWAAQTADKVPSLAKKSQIHGTSRIQDGNKTESKPLDFGRSAKSRGLSSIWAALWAAFFALRVERRFTPSCRDSPDLCYASTHEIISRP